MNASRDSDDSNGEEEMLQREAREGQEVGDTATTGADAAAAKDQAEETHSKITEDTEAGTKTNKPVKRKAKKVVKKPKKGKKAEDSDGDAVSGVMSLLLETPSKSGKRKLDSGDEQTDGEEFGSAKKKSKKAVATPKKHNTRGVARKVKSTPKKASYDPADDLH
ncbi:hypothetical protein MBM_03217 [Drepanopeziza brunnea f. sp. 'multigermtubi' MB_m1]|uniref:Uncharacterized protein n=2 Tax=Drepanopeziza brunnea f. sp. 'multigermtubi' TaxID=698441 RepID=K1WMP0_MARBU|nr:uncharacterized protein MBM_03217 [Drepanopeziza brunnea f. sp. 'multigermtubi' MB_m1]EKD18975.1 hypothetical protein MBM_03217 [Drepanopeziza brunnea f. sp. 'multigermtubi' MB_m1]